MAADTVMSSTGFLQAGEILDWWICVLLKACGRFINNNAVTRMAQSSSKSPELLARYCDSLLKKRWVMCTIHVSRTAQHVAVVSLDSFF